MRPVSSQTGAAYSRDTEPVTTVSSTTRAGWWRLALAAIAAALAVLLGAGTASAATAPVLETRVGASIPAVARVVGVHESISAGERWGHAPPQAETVVATGVAAKTACFVAGTPVLLADGTSKPIEDMAVGDKVTAYDPGTGRAEAREVVRTFVHHDVPTYDVTLTSGEKVTTTQEHPFWVEGKGWTPAAQLHAGDQLRQPDGSTVPVASVAATGHTATVYNFEVQGHHDYYVQAGNTWILVHNACGPLIIGDNMARVSEYANSVGGHAYRPWRNDPFDFALGMRRNERMIKDAMRSGRVIIDIGPDFARRATGRDPCPFYNMERRLTKDYGGYSKVFIRDGRSGGVPGLDF